jgi:hypothetical protein
MFRQEFRKQLRRVTLTGAVSSRDESAQVAVALLVFCQQGKMVSTPEGYLGSNNARYLQGTCQPGELHCSAEVIMVGDGKSPVTQFLRS